MYDSHMHDYLFHCLEAFLVSKISFDHLLERFKKVNERDKSLMAIPLKDALLKISKQINEWDQLIDLEKVLSALHKDNFAGMKLWLGNVWAQGDVMHVKNYVTLPTHGLQQIQQRYQWLNVTVCRWGLYIQKSDALLKENKLPKERQTLDRPVLLKYVTSKLHSSRASNKRAAARAVLGDITDSGVTPVLKKSKKNWGAI